MLTACCSGTSAAPGKYTYLSRGAARSGRGVMMISIGARSSSGSAPFLPASANHRFWSSLSLPGFSLATSCSSERSTSVW